MLFSRLCSGVALVMCSRPVGWWWCGGMLFSRVVVEVEVFGFVPRGGGGGGGGCFPTLLF